MTRIPFLDLRTEHESIQGELEEAARRVVASGWYILGPEVEAFEREFAAYVGARHCIGVANGLDALTLVLRAWGIGPGDEVVVPSNTYVATWLCVSEVGARLVPVEPDSRTYVIDAGAIEAALTPRTRAVIPVHLYGIPADMRAIATLCASRGIRLLDDAAQSHGASIHGTRIGGVGDASAWSFYPTKNLGALGDGGAITTSDSMLADRLRVLRNYGSRRKYVNDVRGLNSRLDEMQAALLRVKLARLDAWNDRRRALAAQYTTALDALRVRTPREPSGARSVWHLYPVRLANRERAREALTAAGIETIVHYPIPPHRQDAYADLGLAEGTFPVAEAIHREVVSLPLGPHLPPACVDRVVEAIGALPEEWRA